MSSICIEQIFYFSRWRYIYVCFLYIRSSVNLVSLQPSDPDRLKLIPLLISFIGHNKISIDNLIQFPRFGIYLFIFLQYMILNTSADLVLLKKNNLCRWNSSLCPSSVKL